MRPDVVGGALPDYAGRSPAQHAVEFVDEQIGRRVGIVRCYRGTQIGSRNLDSSFGREHPLPVMDIGFNVDAHAKDIRLVAKKSFGFRFESRFHCVGELNVNAPEDEISAVFGRFDQSHWII